MNEKPTSAKSNWFCPPFYIYNKLDAGKVSVAHKNRCKKDTLGSFIEYYPVYDIEMLGHRYDIGDFESYKNVCEMYK